MKKHVQRSILTGLLCLSLALVGFFSTAPASASAHATAVTPSRLCYGWTVC